MKPLAQRHIDFLLAAGVSVEAMIRPEPLMTGDWMDGAEDWIWIPEDHAWWRPSNDQVDSDHSWCLGADALADPSTFALDGALAIHATPLDWLRAGRRWGIHVLDWSRAYTELQNLPRVIVPRSLAATYRQAMKPRPARLPRVTVAA